jgi:3-deoxy-manno-octulosonate cytidylyltransferase (CMP-KDO synthetase)
MIPHLSHGHLGRMPRLGGKFMPHLFCIVPDSRYLRGHQHIPFTNMRQQEKLQFVGIIPARYASTRFPGKPLATLAGKPVIEHVYRRVVEALGSAYVATDDDRIAQAVERFGGQAVMTRADHKSGTDRIAEALEKTGREVDVVVNVQGDEPFITTWQIETLCHCFDDEQTQIATLGKPFESMEAVENPNSPKIVTDLKGFALYFSRSVIPYIRGFEQTDWLSHFPYLKHLGIYAYRTEVLREITQLPQSPLEKAESLEQLRWLQAGYRIKVGITNEETVGIDTPEDLVRAERFLNERA